MRLRISQIQIDPEIQPRAELDEDTVADYAFRMSEGDTFPDVLVYNDGSKFWLVDGFHRVMAYCRNGVDAVNADVRNGARRDAIFAAVACNTTHGHRRTNEDKRKSVMTMLEDPEWTLWSDRQIAEHCGVDNKTVAAGRKRILGNSKDAPEIRTVTRGGKTYKMNTENVGKKADAKPKAATPHKKHINTPQGDEESIEQLFDRLEEIANKPNSLIVSSELRRVVAAIKVIVLGKA